MPEQRYRVDRGKIPSEGGCTLVIEGPDEDLLDAAVMHSKTKHAHPEPDEQIREEIRAGLERV